MIKQTLEQFITDRQEESPYTQGELAGLLCNIANAVTMISGVNNQDLRVGLIILSPRHK